MVDHGSTLNTLDKKQDECLNLILHILGHKHI
jgi:hypothetical protein